jgi:hypothetical protein
VGYLRARAQMRSVPCSSRCTLVPNAVVGPAQKWPRKRLRKWPNASATGHVKSWTWQWTKCSATVVCESAERIIQLNAWTESKHFYTANEIGSVSTARSLCQVTQSGRSNSPGAAGVAHYQPHARPADTLAQPLSLAAKQIGGEGLRHRRWSESTDRVA